MLALILRIILISSYVWFVFFKVGIFGNEKDVWILLLVYTVIPISIWVNCVNILPKKYRK